MARVAKRPLIKRIGAESLVTKFLPINLPYVPFANLPAKRSYITERSTGDITSLLSVRYLWPTFKPTSSVALIVNDGANVLI